MIAALARSPPSTLECRLARARKPDARAGPQMVQETIYEGRHRAAPA
jgi:hypothetical protein